MKIGLIVAMGTEMDLLIDMLENSKETVIGGYHAYTGDYGENSILIMQSGIGKVNAALCTVTMINEYKPDIIINTGVAASTGNGANVLDVVVADAIMYHDVYCGFGDVRGHLPDCPLFFTPKGDTVDNIIKAIDCKHGIILSGDQFIETKDELNNLLDCCKSAIAIDMESAAIAHTCHRYGIPMLCIRVISDIPGDDNSKYVDFWTNAPEKSFESIKRIIEIL